MEDQRRRLNDELDATSSSRSIPSPDKESSETPAGELLFINQYSNDGNSASHRPNRRVIGSYVQRNIHRAKRSNSIQPLSSARFSERNLQPQAEVKEITPPVPQDQTRSVSRILDHAKIFERSRVRRPSPQKSSPETGDENSSSDQFTAVVQQNRSKHAMSLETDDAYHQSSLLQSHADGSGTFLLSGLNQLEIFHTLSPGSMELPFHYYMEIVIPKLSPCSRSAETHRDWLSREAVSNPELVFASSAVSIAIAEANRQQSDVDATSSSSGEDLTQSGPIFELVRLKAETGKLLNAKIAKDNSAHSDTVAYTIMCLLLAALVGGYEEEITVHTTGLKRLIEFRGSYDGLPAHIVAMVVSTVNVSAAVKDFPLISPPQTAVDADELRNIFSVALEAYPSLRDTGVEFTDDRFTATIDWKVVQAFRETSEFVILHEYLQRSQQCGTASQSVHLYSKWLNSHFLAAQCPDESHIITSDREEPCRLALLIFWNARTQLNVPESFLNRMLAGRLRSALEAADLQSFWRESFPGLMWMLLLGANTSSDRGERPWFLAKMAEGMCLSGITQWQSMKTLLRRLLYMEHIYEAGFERNWQEACALTLVPRGE